MAIVRYPLCATALAPLLLGTALVSPASAQQRIGVNSAVNPEVTGIPPGAAPRRLVLGQEVVFNERITTGTGGQTQVLFVDQSTMTVGPNSDMVIDEFVYDPAAGTGKLAASYPVRVIEAFIDELDLATLGFDGVVPETTGRPAYHPATLL